jgi:DNA excision repair protein ERCC-2
VAASDQDPDPERPYLRFFPYGTPYENQREAMDRIRGALGDGRDVLFEGACGTGKTLAALAPALDYARAADKTVVITTNVHQQMRQFVRDAREIHGTEPLRAVVFRGKGSMCHIDVDYQECQVLRDNAYELVDQKREITQLEERADELLEAAQAGDAEATEARAAVMEELEGAREQQEELAAANTCERYEKNLSADTEAFYDWLYDGVRTPDEIYAYAGERGLCGYELLKDGLEDVDLVVCNYHHLLDPDIRRQFFRWLDRDPSEVVTVFDEAHNIEGAARDHAAETLTERSLDGALEELAESDDARTRPAANVLTAFRDALVNSYEDELGPGDYAAVGTDWEDLPVRNENGRDDLTRAFLERYEGQGIRADLDHARSLGRELDEEYERAYRRGESSTRTECRILQAAAFVESWIEDGGDLGRYPVAGVRRHEGTDDVYGRAELYTCIPRAVTSDLFGAVHASVLMSATLRPFDVTGSVLGLENPETMAFGLSFPEERRRTFAVDTPPLYASKRDDPAVQERVGGALRDTIEFTAGNTLVFCPSYAEAARYHDRLADLPGPRFLDESGADHGDLRERFTDSEGGALFTSLWGTFAEGVSFDDDDARTVVVVGVPYPRLDDRAEAVQEAYDAAFGGQEARRASERSSGGTPRETDAGWQYAVEIPTVRKTRQALGRVLRSPEDFGVRVLLDRRYTAASVAEMGAYSVHDTFPEEERAEMVDVDPEKLRYAMCNFYTDVGAWDGDPPQP